MIWKDVYKDVLLKKQIQIEKTLPKARSKKTLPIKQATFFILKYRKEVILQKRPSTGIWGGLWSLPEISGFIAENDISRFCKQQFKMSSQEIKLDKSFRHTFSHYHLDILPIFIEIKAKPCKLKKCNAFLSGTTKAIKIV